MLPFILNATVLLKNVKPVPSYYTMTMKPLDGIGDNHSINISVQRDGEMITMQIGKPLPSKRLWDVLILPYNCEVDIQVTELSKFDIVVMELKLPCYRMHLNYFNHRYP